MKRSLLAILAIIFAISLFSLQSLAADPEVYQTATIILYNPTSQLESRVPSVKVFSEYIKLVNAKAAEVLNDPKDKTGKIGLIAVAIRPDRTMKLWVDLGDKFEPNITASLQKAMKDVEVPQVVEGPVALGIYFTLWGGAPNLKPTDFPKVPKVWQDASKAQDEPVSMPDGLLALVWKEEKKDDTSTPKPKEDQSDKPPKIFVPEGFVLKELEPLGGEIAIPKDWFFYATQKSHAFVWTLSKEDLSKDEYETGVRIQFLYGVKKAAGMSPKEFIQSFMKETKKASKVIREWPKQALGPFTRIGVEIDEISGTGEEQKKYRVRYSCFWSNDMDVVVINTSGTLFDQWEKYVDIFDNIGNFKIMDMKKIQKDAQTE